MGFILYNNMFLVDKYYHDSNMITCHEDILDKLLDTFDAHSDVYRNISKLKKKGFQEFKEVIDDLETGVWRYSNFQHLIVYGNSGCGKEYLINKLLAKIYGKQRIKTKNVEYIISGYGNTKTKVTIKQSKHHIIIEPNSNGFDKYLIQEIIQNYAKIELLNILKYKKLFKVVVINKIDNLSYYAQASLRRTMEKYANTCKFIFISDQLSKIIEPIRSRCLLIRVPLPDKYKIMSTLMTIGSKENIKLSPNDYIDIIDKSENKMNIAIWLLEMKQNNLNYDKDWKKLLDKIIELITDYNNYNQKKMLTVLNKIKNYFYLIFITNISSQEVIRKLMYKLLKTQTDIKLKLRIIEITSIFESRISQGTRHIIHQEAYIIRLIYLLSKHKDGSEYYFNLDTLEM
jgi:replication factor C subunit 3/5